MYPFDDDTSGDTLEDAPPPLRKGKSALTLHELKFDGKLYRLAYVRCGKEKCWCSDQDGRVAKGKSGHGPYWFRMIRTESRWIKKYIGKRLIVDGREIVLIYDAPKGAFKLREQTALA